MKTRVVLMGVLALGFMAIVGIIGQPHNESYAANTLSGINEVITVATTDGQPPDASTDIMGVSGDGNSVLFQSTATNLPGYNTIMNRGIYVYNIKNNSTSRIDVSTAAAAAGGIPIRAFISESGRYVLLQSRATNLVDGTTSYSDQLYIHDMDSATTTRVTNESGSSFSDGSKLEHPLGISNDGRFVLDASRYIANGYPNSYGVVYGDRSSGTFNWTSLGNQNYSSTNDMYFGGMSCDGSFAVYQRNGIVYVADLRNGSTTTVAIGGYLSTSPVISCNGTYILYTTTNRTDISPTPSGLNSYPHLVIYNRISGSREYTDSNSSGVFSNAYDPGLTSVSNLGDIVLKYNGSFYLKHLSDGSGTLEPVARNINGSYVNVTTTAQITSNGRYLFFTADPYSLGLTSSPAGTQIIRAKTNL